MADTTTKTLSPSRISIGARIEELDTPAVLIDLEQLGRNISEWQSAMNRYGVEFRPHIKSHKIPDIAHMQIAAGAVGIASAKISEAEPFAAAGIRNICIAYPVIGKPKWQRITELARSGVHMIVNCDSEIGARGLSEAASVAGVKVHLQIDIDTGMHRGGFPFDDISDIVRLARLIMSLPGVEFDGITTHRGVFFEGATTPEAAGLEEGRLLAEVSEKLRRQSVDVHSVTAGGTFTGRWVAKVPGITEVRAGTYAFYDLMHLDAGTATTNQLALSVLCSVVSQHGAGRLTIDGGSKTFSGDRGVITGQSGGTRAIATAVGRDISVERLTEEHGMARMLGGERVEIGEKIRFHPFHACTCVNLANEVIGVRNDRVETVWPVAARGLRT